MTTYKITTEPEPSRNPPPIEPTPEPIPEASRLDVLVAVFEEIVERDGPEVARALLTHLEEMAWSLVEELE